MGAASALAAIISQEQSSENDADEIVLEVAVCGMEVEDDPSIVIVVCSTTTTVAGVLQYSWSSSRALSVAEGP